MAAHGPQPTDDPSAAQQACRAALTDLLVAIDPGRANELAVTLLRLAAAVVALGEAYRTDGPQGAAAELLLTLTEGPPDLPPALAAAVAA